MDVKIIPSPHGGRGLINRIIPETEKESFLRKVSPGKMYTISAADLATFYRIADGTLSPLEGPMDKSEFNNVLDSETIERNGKKYAWTIPIVFPISKKESERFEAGETVLVKDEMGAVVGGLKISEIYHFDKNRYNNEIWASPEFKHPYRQEARRRAV